LIKRTALGCLLKVHFDGIVAFQTGFTADLRAMPSELLKNA
jgi:hypothetical protein